LKKAPPEISICIPVHNTEEYLVRCLHSLAGQDFSPLELVLINDRSTGTDKDGRSCKKIIKDFHKKSKIPLVYIEHHRPVPLLETRRELVEHSHGRYILMVDSDDFLPDGALKKLYDSALKTGADITCGRDRIFQIKDGESVISDRQFAAFKEGLLSDREILDSYLVKSASSAFLWAKLIKRELYLKAFNQIPYMDSSIAVDIPIYFFLAYHAKSYQGIDEVVYYYQINEGITGNKAIMSLDQWKRHCTTASIFTLLLTFEGSLTEEERAALRSLSRTLLKNSIIRLRGQVYPPLQPQARSMLCDYWGESFVERMEEAIQEKEEGKK